MRCCATRRSRSIRRWRAISGSNGPTTTRAISTMAGRSRGRPTAAVTSSITGDQGMILRDRIGVDVGRKLSLEDGVAWAAAHRVRFIDVQLDAGANALGTIDAKRAAAVRASCERAGIHLGLHTASAVNVAEYAPYVGEAVDAYLRAYVDAAVMLGAEWVVVHAGLPFTSDRHPRMQVGRVRPRRLAG